MGKTKIEWADFTWSPVRGCTRVSSGCEHCYAERMAARFSKAQAPGSILPEMFHGYITNRRWNGRVELIESQLEIPLLWRKPRRIFVNSMSDTFHEALPDAAIDRIFAVIALCPQHTFMVLTKRPARMREWARFDRTISIQGTAARMAGGLLALPCLPFRNVWLGVSVEDQATANERIPLLLQTPATKRFVSVEPMLGPVDLGSYVSRLLPQEIGTEYLGLPGRLSTEPRLDWVICGGESGHGARPADIRWFRSIRDQCVSAAVPYYHKQNGEWAPGLLSGGWITPRMDGPKFPAQAVGRNTHDFGDGYGAICVGKRAAGRMLDGWEWNEAPR